MLRCFALVACLSIASISVNQNINAQSLRQDLERNKIVSLRQGQAVSALVLGDFKADDYARSFESNFSELAKVLPNVSSARLLKSADGKTLLIVKVRGLALSSGLVFEVKDIQLAGSGYLSKYDKVDAEIPISTKSSKRVYLDQVNAVLSSALRDEMAAGSSASKSSIMEYGRVSLVGPLNHLQVYPGLQMSARVSFYKYTSPSAKQTGLIGFDIGFVQGRRSENLGDIFGFGAHGMMIAEKFIKNYMGELRVSMENFNPGVGADVTVGLPDLMGGLRK